MRSFDFDAKLIVGLTVDADTEAEARRTAREFLSGAAFDQIGWTQITAAVSRVDGELDLVEIHDIDGSAERFAGAAE